ncbi:cupin domain-containing protein [Lutimaribacter sp. EGI FJ00015]|uniref:Cupin domain-containing protein n=1 Tax=Lutimaribacter degradans TaxID=2945989 RepID=A0ACC6A0K9_9RHOB|nr:cupin domain-containing protein [Lutimaribacter sp. EGI FJ00013]MCM2563144.1 cupin domain-containing protein [Lutimaribacter sp. EGI FJ00013]MCO0614323.1 cupin domain-containing protein [Lutimaribacter sp. EGI FJ00015]MCO0637133.1 cupin domain-containing protein [Lutimaribacter sp. EGI FJ00014]
MCNDTGPEQTATADILIENDRVRVTRWSFAAKGDRTGWHRHEHDYVVVPEFDGELHIDLPGGDQMTAALQTGAPYYRPLGTEHDVISGNDFACSFIEIEMLDKKG